MHLTDCFAPLVAYLAHFQRCAAESLRTVEELRSEIDLLLRQAEEAAERGGAADDSFDAARFAVCAWVDEVILNCAWKEREGWLKEQLQRRYYRTSDAGEEFFERLKDLPLRHHEVREVYYLCLSLGFTGRYCGAGGEESLAQLRAAELTVLSGNSSPDLTQERDLFPGGYPQDLPSAAKAEGRSILSSPSALSAIAIPLLLFLVLLVVFRMALGGMAENLLKTIPY